jgi:rod shape-determining protein MreC
VNVQIENKVIKRILKILLAIIIIAFISYANSRSSIKTWPEAFVSGFIAFPQKLIDFIKLKATDDESLKNDVNELKKENQNLKDEIAKLQKELVDYDLVLQENKAFKTLEETKNMYEDYEVIIADIIYKTQNNWDDIYIINKGSENGIQKNMMVIAKEGLVGHVIETSSDTSKVISILDASTSFSAVATATREQVLAKGKLTLKDDGKIVIKDIPQKVKYSSGDTFETSGIGGLYPKGIKIGYVTDFIEKANPLENEAIVKTFVDFDRLERVAVITNIK